MTTHVHEPVMTAETMALLAPSRGGLFVDCTVGLGGHARSLLEAGASKVLGLDRDPEALRIAAGAARGVRRSRRAGSRRLSRAGPGARRPRRRRRRRRARGSRRVVDAARRGRAVASASVAMSRSTCGWISRRARPPRICSPHVDEEELANLIFQHGEERFSRRIARAIVEARRGRSDHHHRSAGAAGAPRGAEARLPAHRPGDADLPGASGSGSTASSSSWRPSWPRPAPGCSPGRGWRSSPSIRSRIASSNTPSVRSRRVASRCGS